jgi:hypothetical protein
MESTAALMSEALRIERMKKLKRIKNGSGAITHQGGDPTPPGLVKNVCKVPPLANGIPGEIRNCVGCKSAPNDHGKERKNVVRRIAIRLLIGMK